MQSRRRRREEDAPNPNAEERRGDQSRDLTLQHERSAKSIIRDMHRVARAFRHPRLASVFVVTVKPVREGE